MLMRPGWKYLMENDRSPLMGKGCTIMMSHVEALTDEQFSELFSTVTALHTQERNRMFFIASCPSAEAMPPHYARLAELLNIGNAAAAQPSAGYPAFIRAVHQHLEHAQRPRGHRL